MSVENREKFLTELIKETKPEKTGTFCFDYLVWDEHQPILHLGGAHGTLDFTLTFYEGGKVQVSLDSNPSWAGEVESTYADIAKLAKDTLAVMLYLEARGQGELSTMTEDFMREAETLGVELGAEMISQKICPKCPFKTFYCEWRMKQSLAKPELVFVCKGMRARVRKSN